MNPKLKPTNGLKIAAYGDLHGQYVSEPAVNLAAKLISAFKPDISINLGDGIDAEGLSRFSKSPAAIASLQDDLASFYQAQLILNEAAPKSKKYYCIGNHDQRVQAALEKDPQWLSLEVLKLENLLQLPALGMTLTDSVYIGFLTEYTHGTYIRKHAGMSAMAMLDNRGYTSSLVMGHSHRAGIVQRTTGNGPVFGVEAGWLGNVSGMSYMSGKQENWTGAIVFTTYLGNPLRPSFELCPFYQDGKKVSSIFRGKVFNA